MNFTLMSKVLSILGVSNVVKDNQIFVQGATSWKDKKVNHKGKMIKVSSLPPKEQEKYKPKKTTQVKPKVDKTPKKFTHMRYRGTDGGGLSVHVDNKTGKIVDQDHFDNGSYLGMHKDAFHKRMEDGDMFPSIREQSDTYPSMEKKLKRKSPSQDSSKVKPTKVTPELMRQNAEHAFDNIHSLQSYLKMHHPDAEDLLKIGKTDELDKVANHVLDSAQQYVQNNPKDHHWKDTKRWLNNFTNDIERDPKAHEFYTKKLKPLIEKHKQEFEDVHDARFQEAELRRRSSGIT